MFGFLKKKLKGVVEKFTETIEEEGEEKIEEQVIEPVVEEKAPEPIVDKKEAVDKEKPVHEEPKKSFFQKIKDTFSKEEVKEEHIEEELDVPPVPEAIEEKQEPVKEVKEEPIKEDELDLPPPPEEKEENIEEIKDVEKEPKSDLDVPPTPEEVRTENIPEFPKSEDKEEDIKPEEVKEPKIKEELKVPPAPEEKEVIEPVKEEVKEAPIDKEIKEKVEKYVSSEERKTEAKIQESAAKAHAEDVKQKETIEKVKKDIETIKEEIKQKQPIEEIKKDVKEAIEDVKVAEKVIEEKKPSASDILTEVEEDIQPLKKDVKKAVHDIEKAKEDIQKQDIKAVKKDIEKLEKHVEEIKEKHPELKEEKKLTEKAGIEEIDAESVQEEATGFFAKLKQKVVTKKITEEQFEGMFWDLEVILLENNVAVEVIDKIKTELKEALVDKPIRRSQIASTIEKTLKRTITELFDIEEIDVIKNIKNKKPYVICFVGINGSGKTTSIAKFAKFLQNNNLTCVMAAADTFRAAAIDQLEEHANNLGVKIIKHDYGSDAAAVGFDAIKYAEAKGIDCVLIDTAGRLHSNTNLMEELKKVVRVANPDLNIFVGEAITGNDCVEQAQQFDNMVGIGGIILAKADVDEKGGASISVSYVTKKPILYLGTGQEYDDLKAFDKNIVLESLGL